MSGLFMMAFERGSTVLKWAMAHAGGVSVSDVYRASIRFADHSWFPLVGQRGPLCRVPVRMLSPRADSADCV